MGDLEAGIMTKSERDLKNQEFLEFLAVMRQVIDKGTLAWLAFNLGLWYGDTPKARERAIKPEIPATEFAFELGVQLRPVWKEIDREIRAAIIAAAVTAILGAFGLKK